jgi:hypothetical protein
MVAIDVTLNGVSVPANSSATVTIYEDVGDDGGANSDTVANGYSVSYDNKDTIALSDGQTAYTTADVFDGLPGNSYQVATTLDTSDIEESATESWAITLENIPAVATRYGESATTAVTGGGATAATSLAAGSATISTAGGPATGVSLILPRKQVSASGWDVFVDHADADAPLTPRVIAEASRVTPRLLNSGRPTAEIAVPRDEKWQDGGFERTSIEVWRDGELQPIDRLDSVRMEPGRTVLECSGATELEQHVDVEYRQEAGHTAADTIVSNNTTYATNVDDPATGSDEELMQEADTEAELDTREESWDAPVHSPAGGSTVAVRQTCWTTEAEAYDRAGTVSVNSGQSDASGGEEIALQVSGGNSVEWDFTTDYDIDASDFAAAVRTKAEGAGPGVPDVGVYLDGDKVADDCFSFSGGYQWTVVDAQSTGFGLSGTISAGSHTLKLQIDFVPSDPYSPVIDVVAPRDGSFSYTDDNSLTNGYLDGPELYPADGAPAEFVDASAIRSIVAGRVGSDWNNTAGGQAVEISNDGGQTWQTATNSETIDASFPSGGSTIRFRAQLSGGGTRDTATPRTGYVAQELDSYELYADLEDTPQLVNQGFEGSIREVLGEIADQGDFVAEMTRSFADGYQLEWTKPGQREADVAPDVVEYDVQKDSGAVYEEAIIDGKLIPREGETVTADHGTWVDLDEDHLDQTSETVTEGGTERTLDSDYEMDWQGGRIRTLSSGSITDGATLTVGYDYKARGSYTHPSAGSNPRTIHRTLPGLTTDRGCEEAALRLISDVIDPLWTARVTIPKDLAGASLVDDLAIEGVPADVRLEVWSVEDSPEQTVLQLGSRDQVEEIVSRLQQRIQSTESRV